MASHTQRDIISPSSRSSLSRDKPLRLRVPLFIPACCAVRAGSMCLASNVGGRGGNLHAAVAAVQSRRGGAVCGVDEAGLGSLAGPVVAAAVLLHPGVEVPELPYLNDSKRISARRRQTLYEILTSHGAFQISVSVVSNETVDEINVMRAGDLARRQAVQGLRDVKNAFLFVDGKRSVGLHDVEEECVVGGDAKISVVAMASVVAKVHRDGIMRQLGQTWKGYGLERNMGYGTKWHLEMLNSLGPSPVHRSSFRPVREAREKLRDREWIR